MARADACLPIGLDAAGEKLTAKQVDELIQQLRRKAREIRARETIVNDQDAALRAAEELAEEAELAAVISKRSEALNIAARAGLLSRMRQNWNDDFVEGLTSHMVGSEQSRFGSKESIARAQSALSETYVGQFINSLEREGVLDLFAEGVLDLEVRRAMRAINKPEELKKIDPNAVKMAKASLDALERARIDQNKAGAWIGKLDDYDGPQSHDMRKVEAAGEAEWSRFFLERIDVARSFPDVTSAEELQKIVKRAFDDLSTGVHLKAQTGVSGFKGPGNLAKKVSHERVFHFKSADAAQEYAEKFGSGNLRESIVGSLRRAAQSTELMRGLGTNPRANLESVIATLQEGADAKQRKAIEDKKKWLLEAVLGQIDGTSNIPVHAGVARIVANTMAVQSMAKLGGATLSSVTDVPTYASEMKFQGRGMLSGMAEAMSGIPQGRRDLEMREQLASMGVFFESMSGEFVSRFSGHDGATGAIAKGQRQFFRLNLMTPWTEGLDASAGIATSNWLAHHFGKSFKDLPGELQNLLPNYGIDAERWALIQSGELRDVHGTKFLTPETISDIPDEKLLAYLTDKGLPTTGRAVEQLRADLARQVRQYISDRVDYAVIKPTARSRAFMYGATQPGTWDGTLRRLIWQFKAFPVAFIQRVWGREIYGRGARSVREAMRNQRGEMNGLVNIMFWMTIFGYGAGAAKDLAKGREPRDPLDPMTIKAAFLQGGGLGIYGDFLLGETNRFGNSMLDTLAGPTLGTISDIDQIRAAAMAGEDVGSKSFRVVVGNTPFVNLFYTRAALDYLLLYRIQEELNPGSVRRMEQRVKRENNQSYFVPPSSVVQ